MDIIHIYVGTVPYNEEMMYRTVPVKITTVISMIFLEKIKNCTV